MNREDPDSVLDQALRRREMLVALGGVAGGLLWQTGRGAWHVANAAADPIASAAAVCVLSPEVTEGPYWISNHLTRRNIVAGRPGIPLGLYITVVRASTCRPIAGADVEVWHADAGGVYSGYGGNVPPSGGGGHATPNNSKRFLRGHQRSNSQGRVLFNTIYPGWYRGRTPHIHLKVHVGGSVVHTGQIFFKDSVSAAVYRRGAYASHGQADTSNSSDMIYGQAGGSRATARVTKHRSGYIGRITVGVAT
jgi:protocatechuate 3,4-dioxygenase beta subunit